MSNRYEASVSVAAAPAAGANYCEFRNPAARRAQIEEIGVTLGAATATGVGLVRATTQGTAGTAQLGQAEDPSQAAADASIFHGTLTSLVAGTNWMRRLLLPAAIGAGIIWQWPQSDRLIVPPSASLVLQNIHSAAGAASIHVYFVWTA